MREFYTLRLILFVSKLFVQNIRALETFDESLLQRGEDVTLSRLGDIVLHDLDKHDEAIVSRFFNALKKRVNKRTLKQQTDTEDVGNENKSREKKMKLNSEEKQMVVKFFSALSKLNREKKERQLKSKKKKSQLKSKKKKSQNENKKSMMKQKEVNKEKESAPKKKTVKKSPKAKPNNERKTKVNEQKVEQINDPFQVEDDSGANRHKHSQSHQTLHDHLQEHEHAHDHEHLHSHSNDHEETHVHNHTHTHYHDHNHIRTHLEKHDHLAEYNIKEWR